MMNFSNCQIAKVKSFFGLRSIDPPVAFDIFLKNNLKNLLVLIEKNQIIVIDENGNEVESQLWKEHIINFYEENEDLFFEDYINDELDLKNYEEEDLEQTELSNEVDFEQNNEIPDKNDSEEIKEVKNVSFLENNLKEDALSVEKNQQAFDQIELLHKMEVDDNSEIIPENEIEKFIFEGPLSHKINSKKDEFPLEKPQKELEQPETFKNKEDKDKAKITDKNDADSEQTLLVEDDPFLKSNTNTEEIQSEKTQEDLKQAEPLDNAEDKAELTNKNDTGSEQSLLIEDDSSLESNSITEIIQPENNQAELEQAEPLDNAEDKAELTNKNDIDSEQTIPSEADSLLEDNIKDDEFELEQMQGEFEELDLLNQIDIDEKAKITHRNRLIESLKECEGEYKEIVERGLASTNKKIETLQHDRRILLHRINETAKQYSQQKKHE